MPSAETSRRISCDSGLVRIDHAPDGSILDVGRRTRTIPPALRRALEARDRGCRFPGCGLRFTDGHHVTHWSEGGETSLAGCVLLCRFHHRLVHEGGWQVGWWGPGRAVFHDPRGGLQFDGRWQPPQEQQEEQPPEDSESLPDSASLPGSAPLLPELEEHPVETLIDQKRSELGQTPVEALVEENRRRGVKPDGWTAGVRWKREADIPDEVYFRAIEAMSEAEL